MGALYGSQAPPQRIVPPSSAQAPRHLVALIPRWGAVKNGAGCADRAVVGPPCDRATVPSRAGALITVGVGTLWRPNPSPEDRSTIVSQSATASGRDGAGAAGFALDSALGAMSRSNIGRCGRYLTVVFFLDVSWTKRSVAKQTRSQFLQYHHSCRDHRACWLNCRKFGNTSIDQLDCRKFGAWQLNGLQAAWPTASQRT